MLIRIVTTEKGMNILKPFRSLYQLPVTLKIAKFVMNIPSRMNGLSVENTITVNTAQNKDVVTTLHFLKALSIFPPKIKNRTQKESGKDQLLQSSLPSEGR